MFLSCIICSCSGQTMKFDRVKGNIHIPAMSRWLYELDAFLFEEDGKEVYLDNVGVYRHQTLTLSLLSGEANPIVCFHFREESETAHSTGMFWGEFILEEDGRYRIMGYNHLSTHLKEEKKEEFPPYLLHPPTGDPIKLPEPYYFIGYSDDADLLAVRVLKYLNEHYTEPAIYSEADVDQPLRFLSSSNRSIASDTRKEIRKWLLDPPEYYLDKQSLKGVGGKIYLSYLIDDNGAPYHIKIEHAKINKPEMLSYIYQEIAIAIQSMSWQPAVLNGERVVIKRNVTIRI